MNEGMIVRKQGTYIYTKISHRPPQFFLQNKIIFAETPQKTACVNVNVSKCQYATNEESEKKKRAVQNSYKIQTNQGIFPFPNKSTNSPTKKFRAITTSSSPLANAKSHSH